MTTKRRTRTRTPGDGAQDGAQNGAKTAQDGLEEVAREVTTQIIRERLHGLKSQRHALQQEHQRTAARLEEIKAQVNAVTGAILVLEDLLAGPADGHPAEAGGEYE